jgi:hypothetical protein
MEEIVDIYNSLISGNITPDQAETLVLDLLT